MLAAGLSRRFGRAPKLHARLWGHPLLSWALEAALRSHAERVLVTTGRLPSATRRLARAAARRLGRRVRVVHVRHHRRGMGWSLAAAGRALPANASGLLVCPGDMPALDAAWLDFVLGQRHRSTVAVRPMLPGQPAHPAWIARPLFGALLRLRGDDGLKTLLAARSDVARLPVPTRFARAATIDIDTPRELRRLGRGPDPRR